MSDSEVRRIRQHSNRRLFDYTKHQYTTLKELYALAQSGEEFTVTDDFGRDITTYMLLKAIVEQFALGRLLLPPDQVLKLIRGGVILSSREVAELRRAKWTGVGSS